MTKVVFNNGTEQEIVVKDSHTAAKIVNFFKRELNFEAEVVEEDSIKL